jgi:hypothetical protein
MPTLRRFERCVRGPVSRLADDRRCRKVFAVASASILTLPLVLFSDVADAHFRLVAPANVVMQASDGSPQKMGPCGNEAPQTPSNAITPFRPGDTVTVQLEETVYHPGHYRVALALDSPDELPAEPPVTAGATQCGSVPIQQNPAFPILADGMLKHAAPLSGVQSFQVKLPTNVSCTACTLQIIEFMSEHGAPCFYHHCAKISIQGASDAGTFDGGGRAGSSGSAGSGGRAGSGGSGLDGSAGLGGSAGTSAGGATGGTTAGSGGTSASGGAAGTSAGKAGSAGSDDGGGCGCTLVRKLVFSRYAAGAWLAVALSAIGRRRRRGGARIS